LTKTEELAVSPTWIEKYQARLFLSICAFVSLAFVLTLIFAGSRPVDMNALKAQSYSLGLGVVGLASGLVILALVWVHSDNKDFWGQAKDSYTFIVTGGVLTTISAAFQLFEAFVAILPK
jgi:hypothetical protein